ncbi:MAG: ECF transporter S component [Clostridiales bacterium]|jgi:uncharacterized membrane protein|nr:ECF transporter S component [Clostridiales bacterium]
MKQMTTKKIVTIIVLFVVTTLLTWLVSIRIHGANGQGAAMGYWTLGDVGVYLCGALLGGPLGALVAGTASALGDVLVKGQAIYAPATLMIKAGMAALFIWYAKKGNSALHLIKSIALSGALMVVCYFLYDLVIRGDYTTAAIGLPINLLQIIGSFIAVPVLFLLGGKNYRQGDGFTPDRPKDPFAGYSSGPRNLK